MRRNIEKENSAEPSSALHAALDGQQVRDVAAVGEARHRVHHHPAAVLGLPVAAAADNAVPLLLETSEDRDVLGAPDIQGSRCQGGRWLVAGGCGSGPKTPNS